MQQIVKDLQPSREEQASQITLKNAKKRTDDKSECRYQDMYPSIEKLEAIGTSC